MASNSLLEGKTALITGASRGIGAAIARVFASHGARLALVARSSAAESVAAEIVAAGGSAKAYRCDIADDGALKDLVKAVRADAPVIDVLVNNAGILEQGLIGMTSTESIRRMLETNVLALINLTQYAARLMAKSAAPSVINISSIAGTQGIEGVAAYAASKAAVLGFTQAAAKELAPKGIRVNAIAPGFIDTDMTRGMSQDWFDKRLAGIRMGRIGKPEDIANCALFLASPLSAYVTGQTIGVDGGMAA
jgi:3-oxoacyl-[acyl-carrier protein] reductase